MPVLGDAFPEGLRKQFAERNLKAGTVLRMHVTDTTPPKFKFFVIIGYSADKIALGVVYINTEINPRVFPTEELRRLHIALMPDDRQIVDTNCYVDCSKIFEKSAEHIDGLVTDNPACVRGQLDDQEIGQILAKIYSARTIAPITKKKFGIQ